MIEFRCPGLPAPQGSKRAVRLKNGRTVLLESSARVRPYRATLALVARQAWPGPPSAGAVALEVVFRFPRPKSHLRASGEVRAAAPAIPSRPDLDKLVRALGDALTGIVYLDDGQIGRWVATKEWGPTAETVVRISA